MAWVAVISARRPNSTGEGCRRLARAISVSRQHSPRGFCSASAIDCRRSKADSFTLTAVRRVRFSQFLSMPSAPVNLFVYRQLAILNAADRICDQRIAFATSEAATPCGNGTSQLRLRDRKRDPTKGWGVRVRFFRTPPTADAKQRFCPTSRLQTGRADHCECT